MFKLKVGPTIIPYIIKKSANARRLRITVRIDGVTVVAPQSVDNKKIQIFVEEKKDWIYAKVKEYQSLQEKQFLEGEAFFFKGKAYSFEVRHHSSKQTILLLEGEKLVVYLSSSKRKTGAELRLKLTDWYRQLAKETIQQRLKYFSNKMGVTYNSVRIKDQRTRWGSCSEKKNLNFNWRLIMAPPEIIDYVIVHELCHLIHLDHSAAFWKLVQKHLPEYTFCRSWLKEHGARLHNF